MNPQSFDIEQAVVEALVQVYAKRLARAWNDGDLPTVNAIITHIEGNYGQSALETVGRLAATLAVKLVVQHG